MTMPTAADTLSRISRRAVLGGLGAGMAVPLPARSQAGPERGIRHDGPAPVPIATAPQRASPPQQPILMLGTGMHVGPIRAVALSSDGTLVATGGTDKSIRLWRAATGEELLRLYLPLGPGSIGVVDAIAFSPDYHRLYVAGIDWATPAGSSDGAVYVFDLASGLLTGLMAWAPGFGSRLGTLRVSPDGTQIAMAGGSKGLIVRDTVPGAFRLRYSDPPNPASRTSAVAYSPDGQLLATVSTAGRLRLFSAMDTRPLSDRTLPAAGVPDSIAFAPDGTRLAIGYADRPAVLVLGLQPGAKPAVLAPPPGSSKGNLSQVAWCRDEAGRTWLAAAGTVVNAAGRNLLAAWVDGAGPAAALPVSSDSVTQLVAHPAGGVLFGASDPKWGRVVPGRPGRPIDLVRAQTTERMDFRGVASRPWGVSPSGTLVEFTGMGAPGAVMHFDLNELTLTPATLPQPGLARPRPVPFNAPPPAAMGLAAGTVMRSADAAPGRGLTVVGTDDYLVAADPAGYDSTRLEIATAAWGVALARDGELAVVAHGDGTVRWYAVGVDRQLTELGGLFVTADGQRWLAWCADGRFAHSERGGANLVGFLRNGRYEPGQLAAGGITGHWLDVNQLYGQLYNPDGVKRMLDPQAAPSPAPLDHIQHVVLPAINVSAVCPAQDWSAETRAIRAGKALNGDVPDTPPPAADMGSSCQAIDPSVIGTQQSVALPPGTRAIRAQLRLDTAQPTTQVAAFVNGQNVGQVAAQRAGGRGAGPVLIEHHVPLFPGENQIEFRAYGPDNRDFTRAPLVLTADAGAASGPQGAPKPKLRVLVAGINAYRGTIPALNYAKADAATFSRSIRERAAPQYDTSPVVELFDADADFETISRRLAEMAADAQPEDAVVIYFSGHGVVGTEDRAYAFVTADVTDANAALRGGVGMTADRLSRALAEIRAERTFIFLDTCHAGGFDPRAIGYLNQDTGRYVLAASTRLEEAQDSYDGKNGLFAYAVRQSLLGGGAASSEGAIDAFDVGRYVTREMAALARDRAMEQRAVFQAAGQITAFPLFSSPA